MAQDVKALGTGAQQPECDPQAPDKGQRKDPVPQSSSLAFIFMLRNMPSPKIIN